MCGSSMRPIISLFIQSPVARLQQLFVDAWVAIIHMDLYIL